jgi:peptide-methionine (R)-S-oxide reductase
MNKRRKFMDNMPKNEDEWKKKLTPEQYRILREKGTEAPFTGEYHDSHEKGMFKCAACGQELFSSDTKFDSGTGWPSFTDPVNLQNIELRDDVSMGMRRTEVTCKRCGSHLGHLFDDGPADKGGKRYCINSACLLLEKK